MTRIKNEELNKWIENSANENIKQVKTKLANNFTYIPDDVFMRTLKEVVKDINNETIQPYAFLFDYKPHSSKRWVYHRAKHMLATEPTISTYFAPSSEEILRILPYLVQKEIKTIVILDDACYSGEQLINKSIKPLSEFFSKHHYNIKIIIAIPYITTLGLDRLKQAFNATDSYISNKIIYKQMMPSILEILDPNEKKILQEYADSENTQIFSYLGSTLTFFSHRIADSHSFAEEFLEFVQKHEKPYKDNNSKYSIEEKKEWTPFWQKVVNRIRRNTK